MVQGPHSPPLAVPPRAHGTLLLAEEDGVPLTTLYSVGLDVLALCLARTGDYEQDAILLAKQLLNPDSRIDVGKGPPSPVLPAALPPPSGR